MPARTFGARPSMFNRAGISHNYSRPTVKLGKQKQDKGAAVKYSYSESENHPNIHPTLFTETQKHAAFMQNHKGPSKALRMNLSILFGGGT